MYNDKKVLAIIPARSGSKGLPDKNIMMLNGKPMIAYSIQVALETSVIDEIFVSTESQSYADIAVEYGASVPFLRNDELATDTANSWDVVRDSIAKYKELGKVFDICILLQPTSPLRTAEDILNVLNVMEGKKANMVISVCEAEHSPLWTNVLSEDGSMDNFYNNPLANKSRQELPKFYRICGAVYVVNIEYLMNTEYVYQSKCYPYIMPKERAVDIDDIYDFDIAECLMRRKT